MLRVFFCAAVGLFFYGCSPVGGSGGNGQNRTFGGWEEYCRLNAPEIAHDDFAGASQAVSISTLQQCLQYAALNSPELKEAFYQWQRAVEQIAVADSLPDPKISYTYYIQEVETRVGPQQQNVMLSQMFPGWGKIRFTKLMAASTARAMWEKFQSKKLSVYARVAAAWSEYFYITKAISVTDEKIAILKQTESILTTRYEAMRASHPDLLRIQIELADLDDRLKTYTQRLGVAQTQLNASMGREQFASISAPAELNIPAFNGQSFDILLAAMKKNNPQLKGIKQQVQTGDYEVQLAKAQYYPDVTLSGTWIDTSPRAGVNISDNGQDAVMVGVGINIPIWFNKLSAGVRRAQNDKMAASSMLDQKRLELETKLRTAWFDLTEADRKLRLYRGTLIPKAAESLTVLQSGFLSGSNSYIDLLDGLRTLLEFELQSYKARSDYLSAWWMLNQLAGGDMVAIIQ